MLTWGRLPSAPSIIPPNPDTAAAFRPAPARPSSSAGWCGLSTFIYKSQILNLRLDHGTGEAQQFYAALPAPARIGMEATGRTHWFEWMLAEQPGFFHGFLPTPSFRCYYTVLGRLLSLATPTAIPP